MAELRITRPGIVVPVRPDPTGRAGPTPQQVRGKKWRRTSPGHYVPSNTDSDRLEQRIVEAAAGLPVDAAITGWAALAWLRARWFDGLAPDGMTPLPVPVALGDRGTIRSRAGVDVSEDWLFDDDLTMCDGLPITVPHRSVTYQVRRTTALVPAVQVIDMAAADDLIDLESLTRYVARLAGRKWLRRVQQALELAEENAWSPQEVLMRLVWKLEAGEASPLCNVPIFDHHGHHLFTPDLFDPESGVAGEYDGAVHLESVTRRRDLNREAAYADHGIEVVTMMSVDRRDTNDFCRRLHAAYRRAEARTTTPSWTLQQPDWWMDTSTVAARRRLDAEARAVWLRRRVG